MTVAVVGLNGVGSSVTELLSRLVEDQLVLVGTYVFAPTETNLPRLIAAKLDIDARTGVEVETAASAWLRLAMTRRRQPEATAPSQSLRLETEARDLRSQAFHLVKPRAALP